MKILIKYRGRKIHTCLNDELYFSGKIKKKLWKNKWTLLDELNQEVATYNIISRYFESNFQIELTIKTDYKLLLNYKAKKPHIHFKHNEDQYLIVYHLGNKVSFFKNDIQFAYLTKNKISSLNPKKFSIMASNNINLNLCCLLIYAIIIIDEINNQDWDSDITIDLGNLYKELKPFDPDWQPT